MLIIPGRYVIIIWQVPHGFGATLPLSDNTSEDGRQRNRRVQFLVIPDVTRAANK